jgi:Caspase domain
MAGVAYGVVIGIEKYSVPGMSSVAHAHDDGKAFATTLTEHLGVSAANLTLWLDGDATRTNLDIELPRIVDRLDAADRFYFYYAGHGLYCEGSNHLTAWDTHLQHLHGTTVELERILLKPLRTSPCRSSLVFIDACAVQIIDPSAPSRDVTSHMDDVQFRDFVRDVAHVAAFFACSKDEKSYSFPALGHGIWSYHLLRALQGLEPKAANKGLITGYSLSDFLKDRIPRYIRERTQITKHQTPYGLIGSSGDFLIREMPVTASSPADLTVIKPDFAAAFFRSIEIREFKRLPGFSRNRKHTVPDRVSDSASGWAQRLLDAEVKEELQTVNDNAKQILNLGRRDVKFNSSIGEGSVDSDKFRFEISTGQSNANPGEAYVQREIVLRVPPSDLPDNFDDIFPEAVDRIVVPFTGSGAFYEGLADALEAIERAGGGKFVENKKTEVLTLRLNDGARLRFNTERKIMTITPPAPSGCLDIIEKLGQGSFAKLLGGAPLMIGARTPD